MKANSSGIEVINVARGTLAEKARSRKNCIGQIPSPIHFQLKSVAISAQWSNHKRGTMPSPSPVIAKQPDCFNQNCGVDFCLP
jgi:hypothetical protein